jgi:hypothetical protein
MFAGSAIFLGGVICTLLLTGSVRSHWGPSNPPYALTSAQQEVPEIVEDKIVPSKDMKLDQIKNLPFPTPKAPVQQPTKATNIFDGIKVQDYVMVPPETAPEQARELMLDALKKLPSATFGTGEHHIYVLFDPLCPHCHDQLRDMLNGGAEKHNVTSHWIPAIVFHDNPVSQSVTLTLVSGLLAGQEDLVKRAMVDIINGKTTLIEVNAWPKNDRWPSDKKAAESVIRNTIGLMQLIGGTPGAGTPVSVFSFNGKAEVVTGELDDEDYTKFFSLKNS